jgi:putative ABC transport system permease protein
VAVSRPTRTGSLSFWIRWSWRDLRQRWLLVCAIALVIAIGTGAYTGLGSLELWRTRSNDASFAALNAHDLRVSLGEGSYVRDGALRRALRTMDHPGWVAASTEQLVAPTQVDASRAGETVLVPGRLVGVEVGNGGPSVDRIHALDGRTLQSTDAGKRVAVVEGTFADTYGLPEQGRLRVAGRTALRYVGRGTSPEYFIVSSSAGLSGSGNYAVLFVPLDTAQQLAGRPGRVNQLVLKLAPGADPVAAQREVRQALARKLPGVGVTITPKRDEAAYHLLYTDAKNDKKLMNVFALLILLGAALAAFNLSSRVVEAERREIGVGMALGVPPGRLALRPLAMGAQIALLGVVFGIPIGLWIGSAMRGVLVAQLPLPIFQTPFQLGVFARGAALGFVLPLVATALPVWRGVRVSPIEAISVGFRAAKGSGLAFLLRRIPIPGRSLAQMPVRNTLRAPRRTLMTVLAIGAIIAVVVALFGATDSYVAAIDRSEQETLQGNPSRMNVDLGRFYPRSSRVVREIDRSPLVSSAQPSLRVQGELRARGTAIDSSIELLPSESAVWRPNVKDRVRTGDLPGIVIAEKAAHDLRVKPGDTISVRHPLRTGPTSFRMVTTKFVIAGLHPNPFRFLSYMDSSAARLFGLAGQTNTIAVLPASGVSQDRVERALFGRPGVVSVQAASADTDAFQERIDEFIGFLRIPEIAALALALLIAFNSTSINADERARENASMFAFGVPVRAVLRIEIIESLIVGLLGTLVGLALGLALLSWIVNTLAQETVPEMGLDVMLSTGSLVAAALVGLVAVSLAPLLTVRRLTAMDVPSTLRVVE